MAQQLATIEVVFGAGADKVAHEAEVTKVASFASEEAAAGGAAASLWTFICLGREAIEAFTTHIPPVYVG